MLLNVTYENKGFTVLQISVEDGVIEDTHIRMEDVIHTIKYVWPDCYCIRVTFH